MLFYPFVVQKATADLEKKALNMSHQAQKSFRGIFIGITQHQKGYLVYAPSTRKIISLYIFFINESFSSALAFTSRTYLELMAMRPEVTYTPYATSSKEQTGDIITLVQFEEGNLISETCNDTESGDEYDNNSIMPQLLSKEDMDRMDSGDESDD